MTSKTKSFNIQSIALALLCLLIGGLPQQSIARNGLKQIINQSEIKVPLPDVSLEAGKVLNVVGHPRLKVFPNRDLKTFSRSEQLNLAANLHKAFGSGQRELGTYLGPRLQGEFIRQFSSQREALNVAKHPPYNVIKVPTTAQKALQLKEGDFYSMDLAMAVGFGAKTALAQGRYPAQVAGHYIAVGDFRVEIYRLTNDRIFVRASALKKKSWGFGGNSGYDPEFNIFKVGALNKGVESLLSTNLLSVTPFFEEFGRQFTVSFVYNLKNQRARDAYNQMMDPGLWKVTDLKVINPLRSLKSYKVQRVLQAHIELSEQISHQDRNKSQNQARVRREAKSIVDFYKSGNGGKINGLVFKGNARDNYLEQDFSLLKGPHDKPYKHYRISTTSMSRSGHFFFAHQRRVKRESNALFSLTPNGTAKAFKEMNFTFERSDWRLTKRETKQVLGDINRVIPEALQTPDRILNSLRPYIRKSFFIDLDVFWGPKAYRLMRSLPDSTINSVIDNYIEAIFHDHIRREKRYGKFELARLDKEDRGGSYSSKMLRYHQKYSSDIAKIKEALAKIFSGGTSAKSYEYKWKVFSRLQRNRLFRMISPGLFTRILYATGERNFKNNIRVTVVLRGKNRKDVVYKMGNYKGGAFFTDLLNKRNQVLKRKFDPEYFVIR